jgi:hypothetical protein
MYLTQTNIDAQGFAHSHTFSSKDRIQSESMSILPIQQLQIYPPVLLHFWVLECLSYQLIQQGLA